MAKLLKTTYLLYAQTFVLFVGIIVGWGEVFRDYRSFCDANGTLFIFTDTVGTNPILTPCFWGSIAFLIATLWSAWIASQKDSAKRLLHQSRLNILLIASVVFAWVNTGYTFYKFYTQTTGTDHFGCPADKISNPFTTACFYGATVFLIALIIGLVTKSQLKRAQAE